MYVYVLNGTMYLDREWKTDYKASFLTQHIKGDKPSHDVPKFVVVVVVTLYIFIFFSRFTGNQPNLPQSTLVVKRIYICLNGGPRHFTRGDNYDKMKIN